MSAVVRLLCGPAGSGKTERLLELFRQRTRSHPGSALWLGPTHRAVESIRTQLLRDSTVLVGPRLHAFAEFFDEIIRCNDPAVRPLSAVQQRLLLEEIAGRLAERGRLPYFRGVLDTRGFIEGLLSFLSELKRQHVSPAGLARALCRRSGEGPSEAKVSDKDRQCVRLFAHYERELHRQKLLDFEGRPARALDLLGRGAIRPFQTVRIVLIDGFADFTVSQVRALTLLADRVEEIWITLVDEPEEERAELFTRSRSTRELLRNRLGAVVEWLAAKRADRPAGLAHLQEQLFGPLQALKPADQAPGVSRIEAPGPLGEARRVARRIKSLLLEGTPAEQVLVALRDLGPSAELLKEVFEGYGLPLELEGVEPLTHNPAVAVMLRALRLPDDDWSFAGVTALLRNTYFRPSWPELLGCPEMPQHAEALLRLLGEPRGRDAYLAAVARWAEQQQPGLEDEQAEESRRRRIHELAKKCQPFLMRFFRAWDNAPMLASLEAHLRWLRSLADDLGISRSAGVDERDQAALAFLWQELDRWRQREQQRGEATRRLERRTFLRRLHAIAGAAGLPRTPRGPGRIRILSAELARHLEVDHLFVMGLGERSFPRLTAPSGLLDERDRLLYKKAGIDLPGSADQTPDEMLLFYQLLTRARRSLTLSYPAVDERGQDLLPSSFLTAVLDCFQPGTVSTERRRMLIERYTSDMPLSPSEYRVSLTAAGPDALARDTALPASLRANLADATRLIAERFRDRQHNAFDGLLRDPAILQELEQRFGPERIISPTALEEYVTCPFRFFLSTVLRLEPLEEPCEEIEVTRRGQAFHRALARLHRRLKQEEIHQPDESLSARTRAEIQLAIDEDIRRAPSAAARELWRLEGQRLLRRAERYSGHWQKFLGPWQEKGLGPRPHFFEIDFGLPAEGGATAPHGPLVIRDGSLEVRISGRIDRVDLVELSDGSVGFWIIDYKTGRSNHYTSKGLAEFRRLQLTLYALAVEEVLLVGRQARPLGLAYWLVIEDGPKVVLPATRDPLAWLNEDRRWCGIREQLRAWVLTLVAKIRKGEFPLRPRDEDCTQTCHFGQTCRITQSHKTEKEWLLPLPVIGEAK